MVKARGPLKYSLMRESGSYFVAIGRTLQTSKFTSKGEVVNFCQFCFDWFFWFCFANGSGLSGADEPCYAKLATPLKNKRDALKNSSEKHETENLKGQHEV